MPTESPSEHATPRPLAPLVLWRGSGPTRTGLACLPLFCESPDCTCQEAQLTAFEVDDRFEEIGVHGGKVELTFRNDGSGRPHPARQVVAKVDLETGRAAIDPEAPRKSRNPEVLRQLQEVLDEAAIAELRDRWRRVKEEAKREEEAARGEDWQQRDWTDWDGDEVGWQEVSRERAQDLYELDGATYEALDHYCVDRGCECEEAGVGFYSVKDGEGEDLVGHVLVDAPTGEVVGTRNPPGRRGLLEQLWAAFEARHDLAFLEDRRRRMQTIGPQIHALREKQLRPEPLRREVRAGRNDPCPCGSGKKYKRCCL